MSCIFCDIVAAPERSSIVYQDDRVLALCDIQPINPGHLLVITKAHVVGLADLDEADGRQLFAVGQSLAAAIRRTDLRCEGVNLFLADGEAAFQEIFHIHLHVFPRYPGDGFRLDSGQSSTPTPKEQLDDVAQRIRTAL